MVPLVLIFFHCIFKLCQKRTVQKQINLFIAPATSLPGKKYKNKSRTYNIQCMYVIMQSFHFFQFYGTIHFEEMMPPLLTENAISGNKFKHMSSLAQRWLPYFWCNGVWHFFVKQVELLANTSLGWKLGWNRKPKVLLTGMSTDGKKKTFNSSTLLGIIALKTVGRQTNFHLGSTFLQKKQGPKFQVQLSWL